MERKDKLYLWYSPEFDKLNLIPLPKCKEYKTCRWDKCYILKFQGRNFVRSIKFYYIGEL